MYQPDQLGTVDLDAHFPFDEFRPGQRECIEYILKSFADGKKYVIVEAPTGSGKSVIGMTVASIIGHSYYLTIQKILQSQIIDDFGNREDGVDVVDLKGRGTYPCNFYELYGKMLVSRKALAPDKLANMLKNVPDCNNGHCRRKEKKFRSQICFPEPLPRGYHYSTCPYYERVFETVDSQMALMNFSSFLYQTVMTKRFNPRDLLIVDEAHQLEPQLLDFISIQLSDKLLRNYGFKIQKFDTPEEYWVFFDEEDLKGKIAKLIIDAMENENVALQDEYGQLVRKLLSFNGSIHAGEEWVAEYKKSDGYNTLTLKPVFVKSKAHPHIFAYGEKVLMMSATILDINVFTSSLGIPRNAVASYRMSNRFPVENRPIYYHSAGKIVGGPAKMPEWAPKIIKCVDEITDEYPEERGIIHTHNFAIANSLMAKCKNRRRFLFQKNFRTKEQMLDKHGNSSNTVIVAPAMHEGLDLVDDLSRFQVICKVPWPNYMDNKQLSRRIELDRRYYIWLTALKLVQSTGRSVRSAEDWADTYVLDEVFLRFLKDAQSMLPGWFHDAVNLEDTGRL